jgi:hypothetical protein
MLNALISILVEKGILGESEGEALVEKIQFAMLPGDYKSSREMIKRFFVEIEKDRPLDE